MLAMLDICTLMGVPLLKPSLIITFCGFNCCSVIPAECNYFSYVSNCSAIEPSSCSEKAPLIFASMYMSRVPYPINSSIR